MNQKMIKNDKNASQQRFESKKIVYSLSLFFLFFPQETHALSIMDIAKSFIDRTNPIYESKIEINPFDQIPEGSTLLFRPKVDRFEFAEDIYAVKKDNQIYLSMADFIYILNFAVEYDDDSASGTGWYLREDWGVNFDLNANAINVRDKKFTINPSDIYIEDGLHFIKATSLEEWFALNLDFNIEQQIVEIETPFPFPAIAKHERDKNYIGRYSAAQKQASKLPRYEQEKHPLYINSADVSIGNRFRKNTNGDLTQDTTYNVLAQGEVLNHNSTLFLSGNDTDNFNSARFRLFNRSDKADLLGPLEVKTYSFGDISEVRIPLISEADSNFGFRIANTTLDSTDFATTDIEGSAFPGWDIQLFRSGVLILNQTVGSDGRYLFDEIQLFAGENDFELFFFGPQGEVRKKDISIPVSPAILSTQDKTYEASIALYDTQTYRKNHSDNEDSGTPSLTFKYNRLLTDTTLGYVGFRNRQLFGDQRLFASAGTTSTIGSYFINTDFAINDEGEFSTRGTLRNNFYGWNTSLQAQYNSEDFIIDREVANNTKTNVSFNTQRNFGDLLGIRTSLLLNASYSDTHNDTTTQQANIGMSNSAYGLNVSNQLQYTNSDNTSISNEELEHQFSLRRNFGDFFLSAGSTYEIKPEKQLKSLRAQANYFYNNDFSADVTYTKQLVSDIDTVRINANYAHDKMHITPFIEFKSNDEISGGVNMNFGLYDDPTSMIPYMTKNRLNNQGGVAAFVYHDKNGNMVYDGEDEPIEGAFVESLSSSRRAETKADGYGLINDLSITRATDIIVKPDSLPDPFMILANKGHSVLPVEGTVYNLSFPVHMTGEVDGTVYHHPYNNDQNLKPIGYQQITLYSLDNKDREPFTFRAERDGYFVGFMIPPGDYLMMPDKHKKYGNSTPPIVSIGYEGTILNDMNIKMVDKMPFIPYSVDFKNETRNYDRVLKVKKRGKSSLSETLSSLLRRNNTNISYDGFSKIYQTENEDGFFEYYVVNGNSDTNNQILHSKCQELKNSSIECSILIRGKGDQKDISPMQVVHKGSNNT